MRKSKAITWAGRDVTCTELTIEQISGVLESDAAPTTLDMVFHDRIPVEAVTLSTGLDVRELETAGSPSELDVLWKAVEEVNPFFVKALDHLAEIGRAVEKSL